MPIASHSPRRRLHWLMLIVLVTASIALMAAVGARLLWGNLRQDIVAHYVVTLSEEQKRELYQEVVGSAAAMWDVSPEPDVGVLGRRNHTTTARNAEIRINNAGFRSGADFEPKAPDRFRIICLGDSFVFGTAGAEADRFCDQLETFYRDHDIRPDGRRIETYAVGLEGWTAVQESAYLSARLSSYDPDVILLLSVGNDFTSLFGVTGTGALTGAFSPEYRQWGSGAFWHKAAQSFGWTPRSALVTDLGPESRAVWDKGMQAIAGLVARQQARGGNILLAFMQRAPSYESELYRHYLTTLGVPAPYMTTSFFPEEGHRLPHDNHPNRAGHAIIARHFVNALAALGWVQMSEDSLPPLHAGLALQFEPVVDADNLQKRREVFIRRHLRSQLDFCCLEPEEAAALLGGVLLDRAVTEQDYPWASIRSGFLMRHDRKINQILEVVVDVPGRSELFPFSLTMHLDGQRSQALELGEVEAAGRHALRAPLPADDDNDAVEIVLTATRYFADIEDARMKSFRLVSATISAE